MAKVAHLIIWIHAPWAADSGWEDKAGVRLVMIGDWDAMRSGTPDLILHPSAHGWREEWLTEKHLAKALTWARRRKKETKDA